MGLKPILRASAERKKKQNVADNRWPVAAELVAGERVAAVELLEAN